MAFYIGGCGVFVNCRIGSLEISCLFDRALYLVNCRIGSLEIKTLEVAAGNVC